jgi:hypothetical protein
MAGCGHPMPGEIVERHFLELDECIEARRRVMQLRGEWTKRSEFGFFTVGTAAYLDTPAAREEYFTKARYTNRMLSGSFNDLYKGVRAFLCDTLGEAAEYSDDYALPGFHVFQFLGDELHNDNLAERAHFDLQFLAAMPAYNDEATLSFTLPIEEPSGGASLAVWSLNYRDAVSRNISARDFAACTDYERIEYRRGYMVIHDGLLLHAIGTSSIQAPSGFRITLQGHGFRRNGKWLLYW